MKKLLFIVLYNSALLHDGWITKNENGFNLIFKKTDQNNISSYRKSIIDGLSDIDSFFGSTPKNKFDIVFHPNRHSLDSTWQKDWKMPDFKSECWMVASGVATKLDVLSPVRWNTESCEHDDGNDKETQQLITHELVHVFHAQQNKSPDFSEADGIDWFVEGLATYASGQCDSNRIQAVKKLVAGDFNTTLDKFWTGKNRYGLSGSMVMYIDKHYGRDTLLKLLPLNSKGDILFTLKIDEVTLLTHWKKFVTSMQLEN